MERILPKREKKKKRKECCRRLQFFFILLVSHTARRDTVDTHMYIEKKEKNKNISTLYSFRMLLQSNCPIIWTCLYIYTALYRETISEMYLFQRSFKREMRESIAGASSWWFFFFYRFFLSGQPLEIRKGALSLSLYYILVLSQPKQDVYTL